MSDRVVGVDEFAMAIDEMLENLQEGMERYVPIAVEHSLETGEKAWKENAKSVLSKSYSRGGWGKIKGVEMYSPRGRRKGQVKSIKWYGKTYQTGRYARSIRHQMLSRGRVMEGEIGSPSMPGLAHLLEKGHGYYHAAPHVHIAPAADEAIKDFENRLDRAIDRAIDDA